MTTTTIGTTTTQTGYVIEGNIYGNFVVLFNGVPIRSTRFDDVLTFSTRSGARKAITRHRRQQAGVVGALSS